MLVNTCGFIESAKKDSVDAILAATDSGAVPWSPSAAWPSGTAPSSPAPCPRRPCSASTTTRSSATGSTTCWPAGRWCRTRPRDRRTLLPISPVERGRPPLAGTGARDPGPRLAAPPPAGLRPLGRAEAGLRLRPALRLLRHPDLPRRVRLPAAGRGARRGASGWPAQGVTELVLVSENSTSYGKDLGDLRSLEKLLPRLAARRGHRPGPGRLPAAGRAAAGAARGDRWDAGRRAVLRPVVPALVARTAAADAPVRRHRAVPGADRAGPRARARRRLPHQRHPRLPRGDRGRRRRARALPDRGPAGRGRRLRLLRRGGHRGDAAAGQARRRPRSTRGCAGSPTWSRSSPRSAPRSASASASRCCSPRTCPPRRARASGAGTPPTRIRTPTGRRRSPGCPPGPWRAAWSPRRSSAPRASTCVAVAAVAGRVPGRAVTGVSAVAADPAATPPQTARLVNLPNALTVLRLRASCRCSPSCCWATPGLNADRRYWATLVLRAGDHHRPLRRADRAPQRPGHRVRQARRPHRRQGADRHRADRALACCGLLPWWVTVVILVREVGVTVLRFWVIRHGVIAASRGGKAKTVSRRVAIGLYILPLAGVVGQPALVGHGRRRWCSPCSPGSTTSTAR